MNHSERYVAPPPPYEPPLQHDHKVANEQVLELSKGGPFPEDGKDSKDSRSPTPPSTTKHPVKSVSGNSRAGRPLPPRPADTRPFGPRSKSGSATDIKSCAAQNDYPTKPHLPSFSVTNTQSMFHPDTSALPSPLHHPSQSQSSYDTSRQTYDDRRPVSSYSFMEPYAESSFRRPSHMSSQPPLYLLPQNDNFGTRLVFDPSVAYSDSQSNARIAQRGVTASSFYSSSVSSHLHPDSAMVSGTRQRFVPLRSALRSTDCLDKADVRLVRTNPSISTCPSTPTSLFTQRTSRWSEYEQRWGNSEADFTRDIYPD